MEFIPKYIRQVMDKRDSEHVTAQEWNGILNLLIQQGDHNAEFLSQISKICSTTEEVNLLINNKIVEIASADMAKAVYDTNSDGIVNCADKVVDNSIRTTNIQNAAVTREKLSEDLNDKLDYTYSNVSRLLILLGAQAEIEGSADLVLFGLDGTLSTVYNATSENISVKMYDTSVSANDTSIQHEVQNLTSILGTSTYYTITDNIKAHQTKLSQITNATRTIAPTNQYFNASQGDQWITTQIAHVSGNYYCLAVSNYAKKSDYYVDYATVYLLQYDTSSDSLNIIQSVNTGSYYDYDDLVKVGDYVYFTAQYCDDDGSYGRNCYLIQASGITTLKTDYEDNEVDFVYSSNGRAYFIDYSDDDKYDRRLRRASGGGSGSTILELGTNVSSNMFQVNGKWAFIRTTNRSSDAETYYWLNMQTGAITTVTSDRSDLESGLVIDTDGTHFYKDNAKYTISDSFVVSKVTDIKNLPSSFKVMNNGIFYSAGDIYRLVGDTCNLVYSIKDQDQTIQFNSTTYYPLTSAATNATATQGVMLFRLTEDGAQAVTKCFKFTKGTITLATANNQGAMSGTIYVKRQQEVSVPANTKKIAYIKPTLDGNTFKALDLIIELNRGLESTDALQIVVNTTESGTIKTYTLTPTSQSGVVTKYYAQTFAAAASYIEIVITVTAGSTGTLKINQVLGGVDNEV